MVQSPVEEARARPPPCQRTRAGRRWGGFGPGLSFKRPAEKESKDQLRAPDNELYSGTRVVLVRPVPAKGGRKGQGWGGCSKAVRLWTAVRTHYPNA